MIKEKLPFKLISFSTGIAAVALSFGFSGKSLSEVRSGTNPTTGVNVTVPNVKVPANTPQTSGARSKKLNFTSSCAKRLYNDLSNRLKKNKEKGTLFEGDKLMNALCKMKVTRKMQENAARTFIRDNFGSDPGPVAGVIKGANSTSPTLLMFGNKSTANGLIPTSVNSNTNAFYAVVGSTPKHPTIYAAGDHIPYHVGLGPQINKELAKKGIKGPLRLVSVSGSIAPLMIIKSGDGRTIGYNFSRNLILDPGVIQKTKFPTSPELSELEARMNWGEFTQASNSKKY